MPSQFLPRRPALAALVLLAGLALSACGSDTPKIPDQPPEVLYNQGYDLIQTGEFQKAAAMFDEVERQHPYSTWATQVGGGLACCPLRGWRSWHTPGRGS